MKTSISFLTFFILLFSISCVTTPQYVLEEPKIRIESFPKIGEIHKKELGNSLVSEYYVEQAEFIVLNEIPSARAFNINLKESKFKFQGYDKMGRLYYNSPTSGVLLMPNNELMAINYTLSNRFAKYKLKEQVDFELVYEDIESDKNFVQEFLYNGKSGNTLKFSYREFNNDLIRPAFTQELQYDISESDTIGFKSLRIQILNATNTEVEYRLLHSF